MLEAALAILLQYSGADDPFYRMRIWEKIVEQQMEESARRQMDRLESLEQLKIACYQCAVRAAKAFGEIARSGPDRMDVKAHADAEKAAKRLASVRASL